MAAIGRVKARLEPRQGARVAVVFFTMLALLLLPLRASCHPELPGAAQAAGMHQTWHGEGNSDFCCSSISDSALVDSGVPDLSGGAGVALFVALLPSGLTLRDWARRPSRPASAPPPSRSYYARSARILR